jgi:hypothetical protein
MRRFWFVLVLALGVSAAQGEVKALTPQEASEIVKRATAEVLVQMSLLDLKPIAEALREVRVQRGVKVYLLTTTEGLTHRASYTPSLALAGVVVRFAPRVEGEFLVMDRKMGLVLKRDYIGHTLEEARPEPLVERFYYAFLRATPFAVEEWVHRLYVQEYLRRSR